MNDDLRKVTPDKEKAKSMLKMAAKTLEMIESIDIMTFPSNVTKEYYEVIRELISVILLLEGYKTYGEGAHKKQIEYLQTNYKEFKTIEIMLIDELRNIRNKIAYDGFFIQEDYIKRKKESINAVIEKLKKIINRKL